MDNFSVVHDLDSPLEDATFKLMFESAPHGMVLVGSQGNILLVNAQAETLFGYSRQEMIGQSVEILVPNRFHAQHLEHRQGFAQEPKVRPMGANRELYGRRKDGSDVPVEIGLTPITSEAGTYVLASIVDITERKKVAELAIGRDKAIQESQLKSRFVANISHELRTPLASILGMNELLLASILTEEQRRLAEAVQESGTALLRMVNDILDLSKIEADKVELRLMALDVKVIVEDVMRLFETEAGNRQLRLVSNVDRRITHRLVGDPGRIEQVLVNLVGNALKFTDVGEVSLGVSIDYEDENKIVLKFSVADTGIGLSPAEQVRVFQPFTQADESSTRRHGGVGLGLAISKQLVEQMGGKMGVDSTKGQGALFWFSVPCD
ncbi:MAG: PAS domain S-box protein, partial [Candidatus Melainabacteria bacterium]|nr:PAS domain S-box protein [Candidatus Melainabacteria bacterium]